jgi:hypothetical protein
MTLHITPATKEEAEWLAPRLREMDKKEVWASSGKSPEEVLPLSWELSTKSGKCYTIRGRDNTDPIAIFGVADGSIPTEHYRTGVLWMLGTPGVEGEAIQVCRAAGPWIEYLGEDFDFLWNVVWNENKLHLRWLSWLGFDVLPPIIWGPFKQRFNPFLKTMEHFYD